MTNILLAVIYAAILFCWVPSLWAVSLLQIGALSLGCVWVTRQALAVRPIRFSADVALLTLLVIWGPLQIAIRSTVSVPDTLGSALNWLTLAAIFLLAKRLLRSRRELDWFLTLNMWLGFALAITSVFLNFSSPRRIFGYFPSQYDAFGPFIYKNQFAAFLELLLPVAFYKMITEPRRRLPYSLVFAALFACMVASVSRAGVVLAVGEVILLVWLSWRRKMISNQALRLVALQVCVLPLVFSLIIGWDAVWNHFQEQSPYSVRAKLAHSTVEMIKDRPWAGFGLGTWRMVYPQYATFDIARWANEAHNDWLQWASDGGVGFALLVFGVAGLAARRAWKNPWGLGVPAMFVHCLVDYPTREPAIAGALFLLAGALAAAGDDSSQKRKTRPQRSEERLVGASSGDHRLHRTAQDKNVQP